MHYFPALPWQQLIFHKYLLSLFSEESYHANKNLYSQLLQHIQQVSDMLAWLSLNVSFTASIFATYIITSTFVDTDLVWNSNQVICP